MKKLLFLFVTAMIASVVTFAITPIVGPTTVCQRSYAYLADSTPGGTWSSSDTTIATIDPIDGTLYGAATGSCVITYTVGGSYVTEVFNVGPFVCTIVGLTGMCIGVSSIVTDAMPGGTWSVDYPAILTINATTGAIAAVSPGVATVYYTLGTGCSVDLSITVNSTGVGPIIGPSMLCIGASDSLTDSFPGGTWTSSNTAVATISSTGAITGVSSGTTLISYTGFGLCGAETVTKVLTVGTPVSLAPIAYSTLNIAIGAIVTYTNATPGGTWSSSTLAVATVNTTTGVVTGVASGTTTLTYTVASCSGTVFCTQVINVSALDGISGNIVFPGSAYSGPLTIWLIHYNTSTHNLVAVDSINTTVSGISSYYYHFAGLASDSFRVKAGGYDSTASYTGYVPTYHTSSYFWNTADVINHTSGTADVNKNIDMAWGTVPAGTGFIAGDVTTGANRGSSTALPAVHLRIYLINSTTGSLIQQVFTDAAGHYTFPNIPVGQTYIVHPEAINYTTTPITGIMLTTANPSMSTANFIQHTVSKTITPGVESVPGLNTVVASIAAYPNPTNGKLNLSWQALATEKATITITDITGKEVIQSSLTLTKGSGNQQFDLSGLNNGLFLMNIKSENINYNNKIQVQH